MGGDLRTLRIVLSYSGFRSGVCHWLSRHEKDVGLMKGRKGRKRRVDNRRKRKKKGGAKEIKGVGDQRSFRPSKLETLSGTENPPGSHDAQHFFHHCKREK